MTGGGNTHADDRRDGAAVYVQLALGMALFGSATPLSKIVTEHLPVFVGSGLRVTLGALVLAPVAWRARDAIRAMGRHDWWLTAWIAVFGMFGFSALMLLGMALISGVEGSVVMATTPAVTAAGAMLFMGERANWRRVLAIALAVAGVLVLHLTSGGGGDGDGSGPGDRGALLAFLEGLGPPAVVGSLLVFGAVCCEAVYTLLGRKVGRDTAPTAVAFLAAALAVPLFLPLVVWEWPDADFAALDARAWLALVAYGAGTLALGTWLWYAGIARTSGAVAAGFMGLMPVSALVLSYVLLGETFRPIHLLGFGIVLAGVLLVSWEHARMARGDG